MKVAFGVDVGGTTIKIGLFNTKKELLLTRVIKTNKKDKGAAILGEIASEVKEIILSENIREKDVLGVGFGVPGPVANNFVVWCPNIGWRDLKLEEEFVKELGFKVKVKVTNDATAAAYGEYAYLKEEKNLAFMTLGTGVGGGIVIDGNIVEGVHGAAGEFGHLQVEYEKPDKCSCGLYGCLETVASIRGIGWVTKRILKETNLPTELKENNLNPREIFNLAKKGDRVALLVVDKVGDYIAKASAKIAATIDPDVIVIGGGIANAGNILIKAIKKAYKNYAYFGNRKVNFRLAKLKNDSGMYGALELILSGK